MASRRIRMMINDDDCQNLKLGADNNLLQNKSGDDSQILFRLSRKPPKYEISFDAQYDSDSDLLKLIAYIEKNKKDTIHGATCTFRISNVDMTDWTETFIASVSGVAQSSGQFTADITSTALGLDLDGEPVFAVEVSIQRFKKVYKLKRYIHNIGIFDTVERIRRKINMQEAVKKDNKNGVIYRIS